MLCLLRLLRRRICTNGFWDKEKPWRSGQWCLAKTSNSFRILVFEVCFDQWIHLFEVGSFALSTAFVVCSAFESEVVVEESTSFRRSYCFRTKPPLKLNCFQEGRNYASKMTRSWAVVSNKVQAEVAAKRQLDPTPAASAPRLCWPARSFGESCRWDDDDLDSCRF